SRLARRALSSSSRSAIRPGRSADGSTATTRRSGIPPRSSKPGQRQKCGCWRGRFWRPTHDARRRLHRLLLHAFDAYTSPVPALSNQDRGERQRGVGSVKHRGRTYARQAPTKAQQRAALTTLLTMREKPLTDADRVSLSRSYGVTVSEVDSI